VWAFKDPLLGGVRGGLKGKSKKIKVKRQNIEYAI
jgi:hypothetical protein